MLPGSTIIGMFLHFPSTLTTESGFFSYQFACATLQGNPRVLEFRLFAGHVYFVPLLHVSSFLPLS
jgi:hypothetical protein